MHKQEAIIHLLKNSNFRVKLGAENISIPCPLAPYTPLHKNNVDSRPSMGIKVTEGAVLVNCFTCGFKCGQISYLYSKLAHCDSMWSPALLAARQLESEFLASGLSSLKGGYYQKPVVKDEPLDEALFVPYSRKFAPYLAKRGVSLETGKRWGVGVDLERKRAVIPVRDTKGLLWGAVGRTYVNEQPKYLNYWKMKKGQHLLGAHLIKRSATTIVVEGSLDAMIADQAIHNTGASEDYNVVSILGSTLSKTQAQKLVSVSNEIILALDADQAGYRGVSSALALLSNRVFTKVADIACVGEKDFGSCSPEQIKFVIDNARLV